MSDWENLNDIFPQGIYIDYENNVTIPIEQLKIENPPIISFNVFKPIRDSLIETDYKFTYFNNGDMIKEKNYSIFPDNLPDNISALNAYFQFINNQFLEEGDI